MDLLTFFIGSYTMFITPDFGGTGQGIYTVQLNTKTGELITLHTQNTLNPSYLTISNDNKFLYCNTEVDMGDNPKVQSYKIKEDFSLEFLNEQPVSGGYPCHIETYNDNILVASYGTGNVLQFPLNESKELMRSKKNYHHVGSSINEERQEGPHAHQVAIHPNKRDIYVCDLGIDTIKAYRFQDSELVPNQAKDILVTKGGGPRHMVFNKEGSLAYVLNELTGTVSVLKYENDMFKETSTHSALPEDYKGIPSGSAIRIHPEGTFLYTANRKLEAITIFNIKRDKLELIDYQYTRGDEVREFNITPDGKWLIACHQNSHDTVVYKIKSDGKLTETYRSKEILSPVCIVFPE
ncbi:lactonase family protein [Flavivirga eckloniae]|uniref:6-phosphogluconolactonase n=1 Tax=Flavivirga eckloniae TaxID=1803846 RepID=A0A2K9PR42_9FLAO|nr:lactonase family protein [Flavivirga eckloniae]AUP79524.1 hypothetical protein C1H87_12725 [Flavivirga eckloniae]